MKLFNRTFTMMALTIVLGLGAIATDAYGFVRLNWSLLPADPSCPHRPGCHEQVHRVHLVKGTTYVIDMKSNQFDAYLYLENANGKYLTEDDDSGGNLNARIIWTAQYTGTHNIVATSYKQRATGSYTITVSP